MEYISKSDALSFPFANGKYDHEHANEHFIYGCETYKEWLEGLPAADVVPVVRAHWKCVDEESNSYECSNRGELWTLNAGNPEENNMNFCPQCGAHMRQRFDFNVIVAGNCPACGKPMENGEMFLCISCQEGERQRRE